MAIPIDEIVTRLHQIDGDGEFASAVATELDALDGKTDGLIEAEVLNDAGLHAAIHAHAPMLTSDAYRMTLHHELRNILSDYMSPSPSSLPASQLSIAPAAPLAMGAGVLILALPPKLAPFELPFSVSGLISTIAIGGAFLGLGPHIQQGVTRELRPQGSRVYEGYPAQEELAWHQWVRQDRRFPESTRGSTTATDLFNRPMAMARSGAKGGRTSGSSSGTGGATTPPAGGKGPKRTPPSPKPSRFAVLEEARDSLQMIEHPNLASTSISYRAFYLETTVLTPLERTHRIRDPLPPELIEQRNQLESEAWERAARLMREAPGFHFRSAAWGRYTDAEALVRAAKLGYEHAYGLPASRYEEAIPGYLRVARLTHEAITAGRQAPYEESMLGIRETYFSGQMEYTSEILIGGSYQHALTLAMAKQRLDLVLQITREMSDLYLARGWLPTFYLRRMETPPALASVSSQLWQAYPSKTRDLLRSRLENAIHDFERNDPRPMEAKQPLIKESRAVLRRLESSSLDK